MMKVVTVCSTRPDIIRLMPTIKKLDFNPRIKHIFVFTGQNFEHCLADQFIEEFNRTPDYLIKNDGYLVGIDYVGWIMPKLKSIFNTEKPDCILVLGDVNGALSTAYVAKRLGIPIFHCESGNRCFDPKRVPEEINRYMIDPIADWHLCYTQRSREHLLLEGKRPERTIVIGNPIVEAIKMFEKPAPSFPSKDYVLCTIHRKENIDNPERLRKILMRLNNIVVRKTNPYKIKISLHPSLKSKLAQFPQYGNLEYFTPSNFSDFIELERNAACIVTDSGTIPEEGAILGVPSVLLRFSSERPELLENNSMIICSNLDEIEDCIDDAILYNDPLPVPEYHDKVSENIVKILRRYKEDD